MTSREIDCAHIGEQFQELTKARPPGILPGAPWDRPTSAFKRYPSSLPRTVLPPPKTTDGPGLWEMIKRRRAKRSYAMRPLELEEVSQLLWAAQGITWEAHGRTRRAAPSAGAFYPVETYLSAHSVRSLDRAFYHYDVMQHALSQIKKGDFRNQVAVAAWAEKMCANAGVVLIWTAVVGRAAQKVAQRAYRYIYLDAGHIAQNVALACVALGLGSCQIGGFFDDQMNHLLEVDGHDEPVIYMAAVGPQ